MGPCQDNGFFKRLAIVQCKCFLLYTFIVHWLINVHHQILSFSYPSFFHSCFAYFLVGCILTIAYTNEIIHN
jgi:hypothetical protein